MKDAPGQGNAPFGEERAAAGRRAGTAAMPGEWLCSRLFMPLRHPSIDLIAHTLGQAPGHARSSSDGRYQAAMVGTDTLIVDIASRRMHRAPGVYLREFDDAPPEGIAAPALRVEGEETATAFAPTWTDVQWIALSDPAPAGFWSPWPDPRVVGLPPLAERLATEWTSDAPQATERVKRSAAGWIGWLVALAVLGFMASFGFEAITWSLRGGWEWLWLLAGVPFFGIFSVATVTFIATTLRERRRVRVALENMSLELGEGFRMNAPLDQRLRATVPAARDGERTVAPERIVVRLMQRAIRHEPGGRAVLVDECRDETAALCENAREDRRIYAWTLGAHAAREGASQWFVALHDAAMPDGPPFLVAALRELPSR